MPDPAQLETIARRIVALVKADARRGHRESIRPGVYAIAAEAERVLNEDRNQTQGE